MAQVVDVLLQTEQTGGSFRCLEFTGVPAARRSWICIASSGSAQARQLVRELSRELEAILWQSSAVERKENPCTADPSNLDTKADPEVRKLLVLVASADSQLDDIDWYEKWNDDDAHANVMVALPGKAKYEDLFTPAVRSRQDHLLRRVNASMWQERVAEIVPGILSRAEITSETSRVFVSYRRLETLSLALQLFDALTHEGFEVFLDRFSIPPGFDFQRRLNQELADKSMVLLLESMFIRKSEWTQHEIDFTLRNRLGLLVVRMPGLAAESSVAAGDATPLDKSDFLQTEGKDMLDETGAAYKQWGELTQQALARVVKDTKRVHAEALFKRRHRLRADIVATFMAKGVPVQYSAVGPFQVSENGVDHLICTTARPPEVNDFHDLHSSCSTQTGLPRQGALVGPLAAFEPDRKRRLAWLEEVSRCACFDEGNLGELASWVLTGKRI